jgi:hypothetical protein
VKQGLYMKFNSMSAKGNYMYKIIAKHK